MRFYGVCRFPAELSGERSKRSFFLFDDHCNQAVTFVGPAYPVAFTDAEALFYFLRDIEMIALADNRLQRFRHRYQLLLIPDYLNPGASRPGGNTDPVSALGSGLWFREMKRRAVPGAGPEFMKCRFHFRGAERQVYGRGR